MGGDIVDGVRDVGFDGRLNDDDRTWVERARGVVWVVWNFLEDGAIKAFFVNHGILADEASRTHVEPPRRFVVIVVVVAKNPRLSGNIFVKEMLPLQGLIIGLPVRPEVAAIHGDRGEGINKRRPSGDHRFVTSFFSARPSFAQMV